jgi:hypothetical protein
MSLNRLIILISNQPSKVEKKQDNHSTHSDEENKS